MEATAGGVPSASRASGVAIGAAIGAVAGFVLGVAAGGGIWLWAFAQGLSGVAVDLPGLVHVDAADAATSATAGPLLLTLPLLGAIVLGVATGVAVAVRRTSAEPRSRS